MPRKPKHPKEMTSEELARKVFRPKMLKKLKAIAQQGEPEPDTKSSSRKKDNT